MLTALTIATTRPGLHPITPEIARVLGAPAGQHALAGDHTGLVTVFIRHTSASLLIQENADPSARHDLEKWLARLVPERDPMYTHTAEGADDMPSHIRAMLTATSLSIPVTGGRLGLGRWQGVYVFEHRRTPQARQVLVHVGP